MKFAAALLALSGLASAADVANSTAQSFADLGDGVYTVPVVNGTLHYAGATLDDASSTSPSVSARGPNRPPGKCDPHFPTRKTTCRPRDIIRADYLKAYDKFLDWIANGPEDGWIGHNQCKTILSGTAAVMACSLAGKQPTCAEELTEAMTELDTYCAEDEGGDLKIQRWAKVYSRHNVRDGDGLKHFLAQDDDVTVQQTE
ncbi:hypothetical protein GGR53DRAFT_529664 [Hypoxylon sp. FL1150]|nr:hypothetical protein GGR53DRAFT_529664 [Hypoxylon sp. FL1150]